MITNLSQLITAIRTEINSVDLPPALIFNCHITGLAVARSLGKYGVPIIALDSDDQGLGGYSRFTKVAGQCPYPLDDVDGFINLLLEIGTVLKQKAVLFPCLDEWVFAVARNRVQLEKYFILPFSQIETIERILDKQLLYKKCTEQAIPIPRTYYIGEQSPQEIAREIAFPCIVKPALQREFTNEFGEKVFRVENKDDFLQFCQRASHHSLLAQEIVNAGVDSFYSLCSYISPTGKVKGLFVGRKLAQYPPDFGTACLVDSHYIESITRRGLEILHQFNYHGISEVEFIYDERDHDYKLLDINTRVWKWIGLPIAAGIDLPWLSYAEAINRKVEPASRQIENLRWVFLRDYFALRRERPDITDLDLTNQDWLALINGQTTANPTIIEAVLSHDDPQPFIKLIESLFATRKYYCAC
ncbi:MAG: carboxylate--amine ligase [Acidobacteriota bacterium]